MFTLSSSSIHSVSFGQENLYWLKSRTKLGQNRSLNMSMSTQRTHYVHRTHIQIPVQCRVPELESITSSRESGGKSPGLLSNLYVRLHSHVHLYDNVSWWLDLSRNQSTTECPGINFTCQYLWNVHHSTLSHRIYVYFLWYLYIPIQIKKNCLTAAQDRKGLTPVVVACNMKQSFLLSFLYISML